MRLRLGVYDLMAAKKATVKKATAKKNSSAGKPAAKKASSKVATARGKTAKRKTTSRKVIPVKKAIGKRKAATSKKAVTKKTTSKKMPAKKATAKKATAKAAVPKPVPVPRKAKPKPIKTPYSRKELNQFRQQLLGMRDQMSGQISALKNESLNRRDKIITEEDGTDTFDRDFALNLASSEQDAVFEIDEALRRIEQKTYGICEISGAPINRERLDAIPYVRLSVRAQEQIEKGIGRARMKSDRGLLGIERIDSVSMTGSD